MLGVLCARPKPWIVAALSFVHGGAAHQRLAGIQLLRFLGSGEDRSPRRHHSSACRLGDGGGGAASIWHAILPAGGDGRRSDLRAAGCRERKGEGSWNVAWDARPARWLHRPDSAWLLFGVCACLAPLDCADVNPEGVAVDERTNGSVAKELVSDSNDKNSANYKVTGVLADGRCLFRALAHGACLRSGEKAPDDNRQRELADELRAKVVDELLKRREETEWFIEGDFDAYVERIQQPYVWGGEPELLMASHVLRTPISVSMIDRSSGDLIKIANYGEEYKKDEESPIDVLFHGYGHYDLLETWPDQSCQREKMSKFDMCTE
ncbi:uncharacterized protein LOC131165606 [Malania oleifera]|uniref:uncharacterized protein LOC131165606 n=1 Tax=Malania oleifera TaxID=397392 RepID=UPI0025AE1CDE|nr:uncharacterized protein LOC131165606 [Malania oleifera]